MTGLLMKDMYTMRQNLKSMVFVLVVWSVVFMWGNKSGMFLIPMFMMVAGMNVLSLFSYDRQTKWEAYILTMPVPRWKIVLEKYLCVVISCVIFGTMAIAAVTVAQILKGNGLGLEFVYDLLINWLIGITITFFYNSLAIPLTYWLGVEKARLIPSVTIGAFVFLFVLFASKYEILERISEHSMTFFFIGAAAVTAIITIFSYLVSVSAYNKKEF